MAQRIRFIVNPTAGKGRSLARWQKLDGQLSTFKDWDTCVSESVVHAQESAREAAAQGYERVIAVGGDGMMNLVGNAILGSDSVLGVVPCGTGNDWARTIGVSQVPEEALRTAFEGKVVLSDVGWVPGHRHFFNVAGIGFDAEVSRTIDALPQVIRALGSSPSYVISVLTTFLRYKSPDVSLMLDGQGVDVRKMLLLAIGIARYYGSGMMILPDAQIDDGLFDIAWGCDLKMSELSGLMKKIYSGAHVDHPKTQFKKGSTVTASSKLPVPFHLDGDVAGVLPVEFQIKEKAIRIVTGG